MREKLVKLADKFDQEGKHDLAAAIDKILSTASRSKAPLKGLSDDVKKDLLKFIHQVKGNSSNSVDSLNEFNRRLRYFDRGGLTKELGLDRAVKDLHKVQNCIDEASKSMYAMSYGKQPSSADMEQLAKDFAPGDMEDFSPLDFFDSQEEKPDAVDFDEREVEVEEDLDSESLEDELKSMYDAGGPTEPERELNDLEWDADEEVEEEAETSDEEDLGEFWGE